MTEEYVDQIRGEPYTEPESLGEPAGLTLPEAAAPSPAPQPPVPTPQADVDRAQELQYAQQIQGEITASLARMRVLQKLAMDDNERQQTQATVQRLHSQLDTLHGEYPELTRNPREIA